MTAREPAGLSRALAAGPVVYLARRLAGGSVSTARLAGTGAASGLSDPPFPAVDREVHLAGHALSRHWAFGGGDDSEQEGRVFMRGPGPTRAFRVNILRHADDPDSAIIVVRREELASPAEELPGLVDAIPAGIAVRDEHGRVQFANAQAEAILAGGAHGGPEWMRLEGEADRQALSTGAPCEFVAGPAKAQDGRTYHCTVFPVPAPPGAARRVGSLITDITRQRLLEQEAQGLSERRRGLLGTQREFISMVSHEFRTPLTTIEGAQFLVERLLVDSGRLNAADAANVRKWFALHASALATLKKLVDQVLMLNRTEHITGEASLEVLSPAEILRDTVGRFNDSMGTARVVLRDDTPPGYAACLDPRLVRAAAENLISNGLKYSAPEKAVRVRVFPEGGGWAVEVADEGRGIPPADQSKLFRPFFRAGNVGAVPGTGLGLAIVQRAVEFHTGRVEFESAEGSGTRFTLHFPGRPHPLVDGAPPARESPIGGESSHE
jgi:signal transduction histidine kinase